MKLIKLEHRGNYSNSMRIYIKILTNPLHKKARTEGDVKTFWNLQKTDRFVKKFQF